MQESFYNFFLFFTAKLSTLKKCEEIEKGYLYTDLYTLSTVFYVNHTLKKAFLFRTKVLYNMTKFA